MSSKPALAIPASKEREEGGREGKEKKRKWESGGAKIICCLKKTLLSNGELAQQLTMLAVQ